MINVGGANRNPLMTIKMKTALWSHGPKTRHQRLNEMTPDKHAPKTSDKNRRGVPKPINFPSHANPSQKKAGNAKMILEAGKDIIKSHAKLRPSSAHGTKRPGETSPGG